MLEFPILTLKNRRILEIPEDEEGDLSCVERIYLLDTRGLERGKISFSDIMKISDRGRRDVWVDANPRDVGDVMDILISGGSVAVIRYGYRWWRETLLDALEVTDNVALHFEHATKLMEMDLGWALDKGLRYIIIWNHGGISLPDMGTIYYRVKGGIEGCPPWMRWKLVERRYHAIAHGDRGRTG